MKTLVFMTLVMLGFSMQTVPTHNSHAADEAVMRESVKQMETGWNTKTASYVPT